MGYLDFSGRCFLVTGASSGLGRAVSISLSDCGAILILTGKNETKLNETKSMLVGDHHYAFAKDLIDEDYTDLFEYVYNRGLIIDGIVHCAGIAPVVPLNQMERGVIEKCMTVNFFSLIELMRLYSKRKYRGEKGVVVAISSVNSFYPDMCQTAYAASKAAVNTAVQCMALELVKKNIRINAVVPGSMDTEMLRRAFDEMGDENMKRKLSKQVLGMSNPDDVANVILFLLSDLSSVITGRTIYADGGYISF